MMGACPTGDSLLKHWCWPEPRSSVRTIFTRSPTRGAPLQPWDKVVAQPLAPGREAGSQAGQIVASEHVHGVTFSMFVSRDYATLMYT